MNFSTVGTVYTTEIGGLIKGFEVLEEKQVNEQTYEVKLKVNVYDYSARGLTPRVKVALMPVKTMASSCPPQAICGTIPDCIAGTASAIVSKNHSTQGEGRWLLILPMGR